MPTRLLHQDEDEQRAEVRRVPAGGRADDGLEEGVQSAEDHLDGHLRAARESGAEFLAQADEEEGQDHHDHQGVDRIQEELQVVGDRVREQGGDPAYEEVLEVRDAAVAAAVVIRMIAFGVVLFAVSIIDPVAGGAVDGRFAKVGIQMVALVA